MKPLNKLTFKEKFELLYHKNPNKMKKALLDSLEKYRKSANVSSYAVQNRIARINDELQQLNTIPIYLWDLNENTVNNIQMITIEFQFKAMALKIELELAQAIRNTRI